MNSSPQKAALIFGSRRDRTVGEETITFQPSFFESSANVTGMSDSPCANILHSRLGELCFTHITVNTEPSLRFHGS